MPDPKMMGVIADHPSKIEKIKLKISSELHAKGKAAIKKLSALVPTDDQFQNATLISPQDIPTSKTMLNPPVITQGSEGSCVSFGAGYNARSIKQYYATGASSYSNSVNVFSPEWLYDLVKSHISCSDGSSVANSFEFMKNTGLVKWATLPYTSGTCSISPTVDQFAEAANYRITSYSYVLTADTSAMKTLIANNEPLVITIDVDNAFYNANSSFIWSASTASTFIGSHCVCIVGYDDAKAAYKIVNSWGTGWGDSGYSWIAYNYIATQCSYAYIIDGISASGPTVTLPVANAGYDLSIPSTSIATLDGTGSYDPDGYIKTYLWEQVSGPNTATLASISNPVASATGLAVGTYVFRLTVTDDANNTATDTVSVVVNSINIADLTVTKTVTKGKATDNISWNIVSDVPVSYAEIKITTSSSSSVYSISPYRNSGTYSYVPYYQKLTRNYQLKVVKSDGTIVYSAVKTMR